MTSKKKSWEQGFRRIRGLLSQILQGRENSGKLVGQIFDVLDEMEEGLRSGILPDSSRIAGPPDRRQQRKKPKSYRIERHNNALFLAEYREGGKQAFLCPEDVYDAFIAVMAEMAEPAHFEVLLEGVAKRLRRTPPDYLLRLCIRFWTNSDPPLIEKVRTRYRPIRTKTFAPDALRVWRQIAQPQKT